MLPPRYCPKCTLASNAAVTPSIYASLWRARVRIASTPAVVAAACTIDEREREIASSVSCDEDGNDEEEEGEPNEAGNNIVHRSCFFFAKVFVFVSCVLVGYVLMKRV